MCGAGRVHKFWSLKKLSSSKYWDPLPESTPHSTKTSFPHSKPVSTLTHFHFHFPKKIKHIFIYSLIYLNPSEFILSFPLLWIFDNSAIKYLSKTNSDIHTYLIPSLTYLPYSNPPNRFNLSFFKKFPLLPENIIKPLFSLIKLYLTLLYVLPTSLSLLPFAIKFSELAS